MMDRREVNMNIENYSISDTIQCHVLNIDRQLLNKYINRYIFRQKNSYQIDGKKRFYIYIYKKV